MSANPQPDRSEGDVNLGPRRACRMAEALGPKSRALVECDAGAFLRQSLSTPCLSAIRRAEGIWIEDMDGRRFMDLHGNSVHHIGYAHPRLVAALKTQMDDLSFAPRRFACEPAAELAERLAAIAPTGPGSRVLFAPGGSEGIEIALKLARVATGRFKTVSFWDALHGAGFGARRALRAATGILGGGAAGLRRCRRPAYLRRDSHRPRQDRQPVQP